MTIEYMISKLKTMTESQLIELFNDVNDVIVVKSIALSAVKSIDLQIARLNKLLTNELNKYQDQDAKDLDDSQRLRDHKSDSRRPY